MSSITASYFNVPDQPKVIEILMPPDTCFYWFEGENRCIFRGHILLTDNVCIPREVVQGL